DGAGEGEVPAPVHARAGELGVPGEAVQDGALRGAVRLEHLEHVAVGVPVVDLQGQVQLLGQGDVRAERVDLRGASLLVPARGAEPVQTRLPDHHHPGTAQQLGDLADRRVEADQRAALVVVAAGV